MCMYLVRGDLSRSSETHSRTVFNCKLYYVCIPVDRSFWLSLSNSDNSSSTGPPCTHYTKTILSDSYPFYANADSPAVTSVMCSYSAVLVDLHSRIRSFVLGSYMGIKNVRAHYHDDDRHQIEAWISLPLSHLRTSERTLMTKLLGIAYLSLLGLAFKSSIYVLSLVEP